MVIPCNVVQIPGDILDLGSHQINGIVIISAEHSGLVKHRHLALSNILLCVVNAVLVHQIDQKGFGKLDIVHGVKLDAVV